MKSIKCALSTIVNSPAIHTAINEIVERHNKITIMVYYFIRHYFSYCFENNIAFSTFTVDDVSIIINIITSNSDNRGRKRDTNSPIYLKYLNFFNNNFKPNVPSICYTLDNIH